MSDELSPRLTPEELAAESGTALPAKEVMSLLDLNANIDLALDTAAPIDLAIGANANIAAPINAAVDANVLSVGSQSAAESVQTAWCTRASPATPRRPRIRPRPSTRATRARPTRSPRAAPRA